MDLESPTWLETRGAEIALLSCHPITIYQKHLCPGESFPIHLYIPTGKRRETGQCNIISPPIRYLPIHSISRKLFFYPFSMLPSQSISVIHIVLGERSTK